jgi:hypothetical protein
VRNRLNRRTFLRGAGGAVVALPLLESMSIAQTPSATKRFVVFFTPNGVVPEHWTPAGDATNYSFTMTGKATPNQYNIANPKHVLEPLEPYKADLTILERVAMYSTSQGPNLNPHDRGMGHMLTAIAMDPGDGAEDGTAHLINGSAGGPSIDQEIAKHIGSETKFRSLEFGVKSEFRSNQPIVSTMSYTAPFQPVIPENDPMAAYTRIFSDGVPASEGGAEPAFNAMLFKKKSVLDRVLEDFSGLQTRVSAADWQKLDAHAGAIRQIEQTLTTGVQVGGICALPTQPGTIDFMASENYDAVGKLQVDLLVMALACDLTRVASVQWSTAESNFSWTFMGINEGHHDISHKPDTDPYAIQNMVDIQYWYAQQYAYLLEKMKSVSEGDASLLDNSLAFWVNEQGQANVHETRGIPVVLGGKLGGAVSTGRWMQLPEFAHNNLYVDFLHKFGVDQNVFGQADLCYNAVDLA